MLLEWNVPQGIDNKIYELTSLFIFDNPIKIYFWDILGTGFHPAVELKPRRMSHENAFFNRVLTVCDVEGFSRPFEGVSFLWTLVFEIHPINIFGN